MTEIKIESILNIYDTLDELPQNVVSLMHRAMEARLKSYSPYSKFSVGAALELENGEIVTGSNQENASYPSGLCAERTAVFYAGSQYPDVKIKTMAIIAGSQLKVTDKPIPPCGACRQSLAEYEVKQEAPIEIYFMGEQGKVMRSHSLANLLPLVFDNRVL